MNKDFWSTYCMTFSVKSQRWGSEAWNHRGEMMGGRQICLSVPMLPFIHCHFHAYSWTSLSLCFFICKTLIIHLTGLFWGVSKIVHSKCSAQGLPPAATCCHWFNRADPKCNQPQRRSAQRKTVRVKVCLQCSCTRINYTRPAKDKHSPTLGLSPPANDNLHKSRNIF